MLRPAYSPLAVDTIAGLLLHLETAQLADMAVTALAVKRGSVAVAHVIATLEDGSRHTLDPDDARLMARCIRDDFGPRYARAAHWAESLDGAADSAERQASAIHLGHGASGQVTPFRRFGGAA